MRRPLLALGLVLGLGLTVFSPRARAAAAPPNDNFASAVPITGYWGTVTNTTAGATAEAGEPPHAGSAAAHSVWYAFTPIQDGNLTVHTAGSAFRTRLAAYTLPGNTNGNVGALFPVAANVSLNLSSVYGPTLSGPGSSFVRFPVKLGVTYYIAVDGVGAATGNYSLTWGYNFAGVFYMTKSQTQARKDEFQMPFFVSRAFGSAGRVQVTVTNAPYTGPFTLATNLLAGGLDYAFASTSVTFDDYEMLKTFNVPIQPVPFLGMDTNCLVPFPPNLYFSVTITNVQLDASENTNLIAPPVFLASGATSTGRMLEPDIPNGFGDFTTLPGEADCFTNNVINFEVTHQFTSEWIGDGDGNVHIWLTRGGNGDPKQGCSVDWAIDSLNTWADLKNNLFDLWPESDYATPTLNPLPYAVGPVDFGPPYSGSVSWGAFDFAPKEIVIPIIDDQLPEFNEDFEIDIKVGQGCLVGEASSEIVTIQSDYHDQPAGGAEPYYNPHNDPPSNPVPGANGPVYGLAVQPADQSVIIGGAFTAYNSHLRNRIARINFDGSLDTTFDPGNGADGFVSAVALQSDGRIVLGGDFFSVGGVDRFGVARLNANGSVDQSFNPGVGADDTVWGVALWQNNGTNYVIAGGQFYNFNDYPRTHVVRLDAQGNVDLSFDTSNLQLNGNVWAVAVQNDGKVLIGGDFTLVNGVSRARLARLNVDGSLDTSFDPLLGANDTVYTLLVQGDGNLLVGGAFTQFHTAVHHGVTRLQSNGTLDPTFSPGTAADGIVYSLYYSSLDGLIYVGGNFTSFNGTRRVGLTRLFSDGTVDTSFLDTAYNHFAGFTNPQLNPDTAPRNTVYAIGVEHVIANGLDLLDPIIGGSFSRVGGGYHTVATGASTRDSVDTKQNLVLLRGGATIGPGNVTMTYPSYSVDENGNHLWVTLTRTNGTLGMVGVRFSPDPLPSGPGAAVYGKDYSFNPVLYGQPSWSDTWSESRMISDGIYGHTYPDPLTVLPDQFLVGSFDNADVTILNNSVLDGNRIFNLNLNMPWQMDTFFLGGANIPLATALGPITATTSQIVDDEKRLGGFTFITTNYTFSENVGLANILVLRTNGADVDATLHCQTYDLALAANHARSNINYVPVSRTLTFRAGVTNQSFSVQIIPDHMATPDLSLLLVITNFSPGGVQAGITNAVLTIVDQDFAGGRLNFALAGYSTNETAGGAVITVTRTGSSLGTLTVVASTTNTVPGPNNTPAAAGTNYLPVSTTLTWVSGDSSPKTFVVPVLHDGLVTSNLTVGLLLSSPTLNGLGNPGTIGPQGSAVLTILNQDLPGTIGFSSVTYNQNENGGFAIIPVVRTGGSAGTISASFSTSGLNAFPGVDFGATNGTLTFGPGEVAKVFTVPLIDNAVVDPARGVTLTLNNVVPTNAVGFPTTALLNIVDDETYVEPSGGLDNAFFPTFDGPINAVALQPDGRLVVAGAFTLADSVTRHRVARLQSNGNLDFSFAALPGGADDTVRALALQTDGRMLIGGDFTNYDGVARSHFARLNLDGTLQWQFDPGSGLNGTVNSVVETWTDTNKTARLILVGGNFTLANGATRNYLARFTDTGSLDLNFNPNLTGNGIDGQVWSVAVQSDLRVVIAGDFKTINGVSRNHVARLNPDGSLDLSFDPGSGANDSVRAVAIQLDGRVVVGGLFTNFNGTLQNRYARLNADGSLDATFNGGVGADGPVLALALQPDTRILLGGEFTRCSGVTRNRLTRLNPDGTVDPSINFGSGLDNYVASLVVQTNDYIVLGGGFSSYDGTPTAYLARIFGRSVAGSGRFEFASATFGADETATNALLTLRRRGGTYGTSTTPNVTVTVAVTDGTATNGINYIGGFFTNTFVPGETYQTLMVPVIHDFQVTSDLTANSQIQDIQPLGLPLGIGNQPFATLLISNVDSGVHFSSPAYSIAKNVQQGRATIPVFRFGSLRGSSQVQFLTTTNGTGFPGLRYLPVTNTLVFGPGQTVQNAFVPIINDNQILGDTTVGLALVNATNTLISAPATATLTIRETSAGAGALAFAAAGYTVSEHAANVQLTVLRTNGQTGTVTVDYSTAANGPASATLFVPTNGTLVFADGEVLKTILVPIRYNPSVLGNQTFSVNLANVAGGVALGTPSATTVTVLEQDTGISFSQPAYAAAETTAQLTVNVLRPYGTNGVTQVSYGTTNGTAVEGTNFVKISGTLTFNPGETLKTVTLTPLHDPRVTGNISFDLGLSNPTGGAQLVYPSTAAILLLDAEAGLSFTNSALSLYESATNALVTVVCLNPSISSTATVAFATADGTALAGRDYIGTNGVLTFSGSNLTNTFLVPILDNAVVDGNRTFSINLFGATAPGQVIAPTNLTVTILDDDAGISFSSDSYSVSKSGVSATIGVVRSGFTNSTVAVNYATQDGTAIGGSDYVSTNGVLTFAPGQMSTNFQVIVRDSTVIKPDRTVLLQLSNPLALTNGGVTLVPPSAATLTIVDNSGSLVGAAGSALISESFPPGNGAIDPGETVSLWFAFRHLAGTNIANLQATLLTTNGVTSPSGSQSYGALVKNGPSVSRQFSFTANGTNGQQVVPTFHLVDGPTDLGIVQFTYVLGTSSASFTNTAPIVINDFSNATPYPSIITVTNVGGSLSKLTVTITNLSHTFPSDLDVLLVSPSATNSYLMAEAGGNFGLNHVSLTFDDAAASGLPSGSQITSGTYRPTSYASPSLSLRSPAPPAPYGVGLTGFINSNPLGDWKLFIIDDTPNNAGSIGNGWYLTMTTANKVVGMVDLVTSIGAAPNPVSTTSNIIYSIAVNNYGPASAANVVLTNLLPAATRFVPAASTAGPDTNTPGYVIYHLGTLAKDGFTNLVIAATATATNVVVTDRVWAFSDTADANPLNNTNLVSTVVTNLAADLSVSMTAQPSPAMPGDLVTYNVLVSNSGPATAPNLRVTNTLSPLGAFSIVSASPNNYLSSGGTLSFTNLGNLGSGLSTNLSITVRAQGSGILTNSVTVTSDVVDPLKGNNALTIKTLVSAPPMTLSLGQNVMTITWPGAASQYALESTTNLQAPVIWTPVTTPVPVLVNGQYSVTLGTTNGTRYFRLRGSTP